MNIKNDIPEGADRMSDHLIISGGLPLRITWFLEYILFIKLAVLTQLPNSFLRSLRFRSVSSYSTVAVSTGMHTAFGSNPMAHSPPTMEEMYPTVAGTQPRSP